MHNAEGRLLPFRHRFLGKIIRMAKDGDNFFFTIFATFPIMAEMARILMARMEKMAKMVINVRHFRHHDKNSEKIFAI